MNSRTCTKCKLEKSLSEFNKKGRGDELDSRCKNCERLRINKNRNKRKRRNYDYKKKLKSKYGLSLSDIEQMKEVQNNLCAICLKPLKLVIDHNHDSGKVRALLCIKCNSGLGFFDEDTNKMIAAIEYIKAYNV